MDREKQIEEMARCICERSDDDICTLDRKQCDCKCTSGSIAELLYERGYRKQSDRYYVEPGKTPVLIETSENKQSGWISVEERLPEDEKAVLCYYGFDRGDGDFGMMFVNALSYFCFDPDPHWQHASTGLTVTHWMPLPEPPKMKGGA